MAIVFEQLFGSSTSWGDTLGNERVGPRPYRIVDLASLPPGPDLVSTQPLKITKGGLKLTGYVTGVLRA